MKTKQERYNEKMKLAKRLGLEVYGLYVDSLQRDLDCVMVPFTSNQLYADVMHEVNYEVLHGMGLRHIIFDNGLAYMPLSLLKPDRYSYGIASAENDAIHTMLEFCLLDEDEYYKREMEIISDEIPSMMQDLWDEIASAHPEKSEELLAQYESRSYLIEDMISNCSEIFATAGNYPFLDGGQYPYLSIDDRTIQAAIDVISSL